MAKDKDKDKQLLKQGTADDRAITFQRAVFIVCNLKRLIKRPKKDDKQSDSRKRSGHLAGADCELNRACRGRKGAKEPVRRAFTLPSVVCSSVLARLLASNGGGGDGVAPDAAASAAAMDHELGGAGGPRASRLAAPHHCQQRHHHHHHHDGPATSGDSLCDCPAPPTTGSAAPTGSGSLGRASSSGLTYLATPVRRLNQPRVTGGARLAASAAQTDTGYQRAQAAKELTTEQEQLICPIWAHVMAQLDSLQGADERQMPARGSQPTQLFACQDPEPRRQQQQPQQQVQVRVQVVVGLAAAAAANQQRRASNDDCSGTAGSSSGRPSSKDAQESASPSSDVCCYTGAAPNSLEAALEARWQSGSRQALDSLDCQQQLAASGSNKSHRKKHQQHPASSSAPGLQPMKRFSSALCLADHLPGAQVAGAGLGHARGDISPDDTQTNLDQQVERNLVDRARAILERGSVDVNRLTQDKLTCLDMAILQRNLEMVGLLQQYGAQESFPHMSREARATQLHALYCEAKRTVQDLTRSVGAFVNLGTDAGQFPGAGGSAGGQATGSPQVDTGSSGQDPLAPGAAAATDSSTSQQPQPQLMLATGSILSSALLEEKHLQLQCWRRRLDLFMHMRYELERLQVPSVPELVVLQVVGESSLGLKIVHSLQAPTCGAASRGPASGLATGSRIQAPSGRLVCRRGARCSHWLLGELAQWQRSGLVLASSSNQSAAPAALESLSEGPGASQKLAAFNQLLSQQLEQLQSRHAGAPGATPSDAAGQESAGQANSSQASLRPAGAKRKPPEAAGAPVIGANANTRRLQAQLSSGAYENSSRLDHRLAEPADQTSLAYQLMSFAPEARGLASAQAAPNQPPSIVTKYLIEWALEEEGEEEDGQAQGADGPEDNGRAPNAGSLIIHNSSCGPATHHLQHQQPLKCRIENLESGRRYRVRVAAGNQAGFSRLQASSPPALAPSGWRQLDGLRRRHQDDEEIFRKFTKLFLLNKHLLDERHAGPVAAASKSSLINMLMVDATSIPGGGAGAGDAGRLLNQHQHHHQLQLTTAGPSASAVGPHEQPAGGAGPASHRASPAAPGSVRKNLKNFFQTSSFKFQKLTNQNKRGLYLAAIVFTPATNAKTSAGPNDKLAERVVVTNDDRLPVVEISNELVAPAALMSDFYWLLKINGAQWVDIKQLRQQLQRSHSSSNLHLRIKLLSAIEQLQIALNLNDIGHLFYRPVQAHDGSQVICTCKQVSSTKQVNSLSTKWMQLDKILPRHLRKISDSFKRRQSNQAQAGAGGGKPQPPAKPEALRALAGLECAPQQQQQVPLLTKRRPTMASNSSNSSLASSGGDGASGHWSQATVAGEGRLAAGSGLQNTSNQSALQRHQITTNRSSSGRSASLMVCPQTLPAGANPLGAGSLLLASQQQQQHTGGQLLARHSQPSESCPSATSEYLMQSSLSIYDLLLYTVQEILHFYYSSRKPLDGGLYLGFLQLQTTVESMRLLVPRARPNMVPCSRIRDNPHVSREEWALLRGFASPGVLPAPIIVSTSSATSQHLSDQCGVSNRASDPSIWSAKDATAPAGAGAPQRQCEASSSSRRDRAKSISPGYLVHQQHDDRKPLSVSSEHLGASLFLTPAGSGAPIGPEKSAHSDTELSADKESARSQLRCGQVASNASLSAVDVTSAGQRRNSSGSQEPTTAGPKARTGSHVGLGADVPEQSFLRLVAATAERLLAELRCQLPQVVSADGGSLCSVLDALNNQASNRIYHTELIELSEQVAVILLLPAPENVCPVTSQDKSNYLADNKAYMFLPLQIFETIHISTYESDLLGKYSRLSTILETDLVVAQHDHRQAFSNNELKSTKSRVSQLQDMVSMADEFWRKLRWIVDVVAFARDKSNTLASQSGGTIRLGTIWRYLELSAPHSVALWECTPLNQLQQQQQPQWRSSCGYLAELEEPTGAHIARLAGAAGARGSNQHLPELTLNDFAHDSSSGAHYHAQDAPEDEDEEAIYAYHVSLKDASRAAAAKRRTSQLPVSSVLGDQQPAAAGSTMVQRGPTPIKQPAAARPPYHSSEDPKSAPSSSRLSAAELLASESLEGSACGGVLKEVSPGSQAALEADPVGSTMAAGCSRPEVRLSAGSTSAPRPDIGLLDGAPPPNDHDNHQHSVVGQQTGDSSISGRPADPRDGPTPKLANDKFARISARPADMDAHESPTTNRMAHLRTTNPFLADSLD